MDEKILQKNLFESSILIQKVIECLTATKYTSFLDTHGTFSRIYTIQIKFQ